MKKSEKSRVNSKSEAKKIPKQVKDQLKPLIQKLLGKCSDAKFLTAKPEWEEFKDIYNILQEIRHIEKKYTRSHGNRNDHWEKFYNWCSQNGAQFEGAKMKEITTGNFGVVAEKTIKEHDPVLYVPRKIMITEDSAKCSKLGAIIDSDPLLRNMANVQVAMHLLMECLDPQSFWKPYISILPSHYDTILYFTMEELQELRGSPMLDEIFKIYCSAARQYCYFYKLLQEDTYARSLNISQHFTYDLYRWAVSTVMTRQNLIPSSDGKRKVTALIPFFDMCNHINGTISTDFNMEEDTLISYAFKTFPEGEEVHIFYGPRTNGEFFAHNGFVYLDNENDAVEIILGISKSDPCFPQKSQMCHKMDIPLLETYKLYKDVNISGQLLLLLEIHILKPAEVEEIMKVQETDENFNFSSFEESLNLRKRALTFLKDRVYLLMRSYRTTLEEDEKLMECSVSSQHKMLAVQLRMCEKHIFNRVLEYCIENIK